MVVSAVAKMLTKLLPKSTDPISRSLSSVIRNARAAPVDPLSARLFSFARDAAVSAVSDPEKKADKTSNTKMPATVNQNVVVSTSQSLCCQRLGQWVLIENQRLQAFF